MHHFEYSKDISFAQVKAGPFEVFDLLNFEGAGQPVGSTTPLVVVFVEARLLDDQAGGSAGVAELMDRLATFNKDLRSDGYNSRFVKLGMRNAPGHRDGEGVLAIRSFLQTTRAQNPSLAGAIFIGSFPEAMLVRRWIWRRDNRTVWINATEHTNTDYLWVTPEAIAMRSDIVLADLDGNWGNIYNAGPVQIDEIRAIPDASVPAGWPFDGGLFVSSDYQITQHSFEDFFYIRDDTFVQIPDPTASNRLILQTSHTIGGPEVSAADQTAVNPIAKPDIIISRINARNVALSPNPNIVGTSGETLLDALGQPRNITTGFSVLPNEFVHDLGLERRLIVDYLDRNHAFREGISSLSPHYRTAAINGFPPNATPPSPNYGAGLSAYLERSGNYIQSPVVAERANLLEFVQWMKQPAILKGIITHANATGTVWNGSPYSTTALENEAGGTPWRWSETLGPDGVEYAPSFDDQGAWGNLYLYRTIWENGELASDIPCHILHTGCDVFSPAHATTQPYSSASYAAKQEGEGWLFYMNAVTVTCRSKDINDRPHEFGDTLAKQGATIGDAWVRYFEVLSDDANLATFAKTTRAKDSYWWGILGDWTLQLSYEPELIIPFLPQELHVIPFEHPKSILADKGAIVRVLDDSEYAQEVLRVIRHYRVNERRVIGRGRDAWEYYLSPHGLPHGALEQEQSAKIEPERADVTKSRSGWQVKTGRTTIAKVASENDAWAVVEVLRRHEPTHICWLGDERAPAMRFLRR